MSKRQHSVTLLLALIDQALAAGRRVLLIHEAPTAQQLFPPAGLPPNVEVRLKTEDGSLGQAGSVLDLIPELAQWADQVYAVGHTEWYGDLVRVLRDHRLQLREGLAWGLIAPEIMACGLGVCDGCAVETGRRSARVPRPAVARSCSIETDADAVRIGVVTHWCDCARRALKL